MGLRRTVQHDQLDGVHVDFEQARDREIGTPEQPQHIQTIAHGPCLPAQTDAAGSGTKGRPQQACVPQIVDVGRQRRLAPDRAIDPTDPTSCIVSS